MSPEGQPGSEPQWWLNPAIAQLAFGDSAHAQASGLPGFDSDRIELDLSDPEQRRLGEFELLELIGEGGMGMVYRAQQVHLQREVAVKLLSSGPWASPAFIERFQQEARHAAKLQHPSIVTVFEMGEFEGLVYYAMQLVRGESLAQHLLRQGGKLSERQAAALIRTTAEAVDYAHTLGVLHLDLKPANILLGEDAQPRVADFGLSRFMEPNANLDNLQTAGTPSYMAPEQAVAGKAQLSRATDVWGLGAILYELLTGQPPFEAADATSTLQLLQHGAVRRPSRFAPMSPDLEAICLKCLAKPADERYPTARALADDLGRLLEGRAVSVRPLNGWQRTQRWMRREPRLAMAISAATLALIAGLIATSMQWRRAEQHSQLAEHSATLARETLWQKRIDETADRVAQHNVIDVLPDLVRNLAEQEIAGANEAADASRVRIGSVLAAAPVLIDSIATGASISSILLDPGGEWVVVVTDARKAQCFDTATGNRRWVLEYESGNQSFRLVAARDSRFVIAETFFSNAPLARGIGNRLIDLEHGKSIDPPLEQFPHHYNNHFSPDGEWVVVVTLSATQGGSPSGRLVRVSDWRTMGAEKTLDGLSLLGPEAAWLAYYEPGTDDDRHRPKPVQVLDPRSMSVRWQYKPANHAALRAWRIAPRADVLALGFADGEVGLFDPADGNRRDLPSQVHVAVEELTFSPDGRWIAASHVDGSVQVWDMTSGSAVTAPLHLSPDRAPVIGQIDLDPDSRQIYIGEESARLWSLRGPDQAAEVVFERPAYPRPINNTANAASIATQLFAAGASNGELRLWRRRASIALPALAPLREMRDAIHSFDGQHVLDVRGHTVQRIESSGSTSRTAGPVLVFPQAVGFAQLVSDGSLVAATAGRELHVRDAEHGTLRFAPLALPATPSALLASADGKRLIAAWQEYTNQRASLRLRSINPDSGETLGETALDHPSQQLRLSDDGDAIIAWRQQRLVLLDAATLQLRWAAPTVVPDGDYSPVRSARLGKDGRTLWVVTGAGLQDGYRLHALDATSGRSLQEWQLPTWALALQPFDRGEAMAALFPGLQELRIFHLDGRVRMIDLVAQHNWQWGYPGIALSQDERYLAIGQRRGIQWLELPSGNWLSPRLQPAGSDIELAGVALDPDGELALVRASDRRQWMLPLQRESRTIAELQALARLLAPKDADLPEAFAPALDMTTRAALRASDPGPPPGLVAQTQAALPALAWEPRFVDLRPQCNLALDQYPTGLFANPRIDRMLAPGRQRLLGIDFEIACAITTQYVPDAPASVARGSRVEGIDVAQSQVAAIELLMLAPTILRGELSEDYAIVEFNYLDGSRARAAVTYGRDIHAWFNMDHRNTLVDKRVAHVGLGLQFSQQGGAGTVAPTLFAVHIKNPHPQRDVVSLALESTRWPWSEPMLLAATLVASASTAATPERAEDVSP